MCLSSLASQEASCSGIAYRKLQRRWRINTKNHANLRTYAETSCALVSPEQHSHSSQHLDYQPQPVPRSLPKKPPPPPAGPLPSRIEWAAQGLYRNAALQRDRDPSVPPLRNGCADPLPPPGIWIPRGRDPLRSLVACKHALVNPIQVGSAAMSGLCARWAA